MNKNLDVWAIQKHPEELYTALENVKTDQGDLILFTNLECNFRLNGNKIRRSFDTSLYYDTEQGNDALILLMEKGQATADDIRDYLEEKGFEYQEVSFRKGIREEVFTELDIPYEEEADENIPELWFAREEYVLRDALNESIEQGNTTCDYYPLLEGYLKLNYNSSRQPVTYNLDGRRILGVISLEDKMILMINNGNDSRNLSPLQVRNILDELQISANIHPNREFNMENPYKGKIKEKR